MHRKISSGEVLRVIDKVSTEVKGKLRDYELVVVISPEATEEQAAATLDTVSQFVTGHEGTIADVQHWGKRRLAYPIKHFTEGNYVLIKFSLQPELGRELEASLMITEEVLRHLLVRLGD